jgi:hypothetical protein
VSDYCSFCDTRRPAGGTNMLVLNGGKVWLEFCEVCGDREYIINVLTGEHYTLANLLLQDKGEYREPTQSFDDWRRLDPVPLDKGKTPPPDVCMPKMADIWPDLRSN